MFPSRQGQNPELDLSVVVPVYNEADAIKNLHREILAVCKKLGTFEILFINDGSTDQTLSVIKKLKPLKVVNLRKNFGQTAALDAGIKLAKGRLIATLDGDGQNDPKDIPKMIKMLESENLDVVSGWRKNRQDSISKKIASRAAALVRSKLIKDGIHDSGCTLKIYRAECFYHVDLFGEMHRFIPALLIIKGFRVGEMVVNHRPRTTGVTKYNWKRGIKGNLDMMAIWFWKKFSNRPLHLFGGMGLCLVFVSFCLGAVLIYDRVSKNVDLSNTALTTFTLFTFLVGVQFFVFGLMADILSKIYYTKTSDKPYLIRDIIENTGQSEW